MSVLMIVIMGVGTQDMCLGLYERTAYTLSFSDLNEGVLGYYMVCIEICFE